MKTSAQVQQRQKKHDDTLKYLVIKHDTTGAVTWLLVWSNFKVELWENRLTHRRQQDSHEWKYYSINTISSSSSSSTYDSNSNSKTLMIVVLTAAVY